MDDMQKQTLILVESPTKARTLSRFLGSGYRIEATMGHIRDLPKSKLGVDIYPESEKEEKNKPTTNNQQPTTHNPQQTTYTFSPQYIVAKEKKKRVSELQELAKQADRVILATDPDREGEAIAWHVAQILEQGSKKKVASSKEKRKENTQQPQPQTDPPMAETTISRIVFHEITKSAIEEALSHPRLIDMPLVDAQQARRVLDRLVGYKLSPLLWNKLGKNWLSAGRVQSVAVRLIVEREREISAFVPEEYWVVDVECETVERSKQNVVGNGNKRFLARLVKIGEEKAEVRTNEVADKVVRDLEQAEYRVSKVEKKEVRRQPSAPFTTSTLQQAGANRYGWSAKRTMQTAQRLYEEGYITYHRTDSTNLSVESLSLARTYISQAYGNAYLPTDPRVYKTKSKVAQEAHEAIRPTKLSKDIAQMVEQTVGADGKKLYQLIMHRFVACQMKEAIFDQTSVDVIASGHGKSEHMLTTHDSRPTAYTLRASGQVMKFDGWMIVYGQEQKEKNKDQKEEGDEKEEKQEHIVLPPLSQDDLLDMQRVIPQQKWSEPPPRYNEASLIKTLEAAGIGRPSTYAPIITTILDRKYVEKKERRFFATDLGMAVCDFLVHHFPTIFAVAFTAKMEDELDQIANGEIPWNVVINEFYLPMSTKLDTVFKEAERVKVDLGMSDEVCPVCGNLLAYRMSKYGKFLACSTFPACKFTKNIIEKVGVPCPKCGGDMIVKKTRTGRPFFGCSQYPTCTFAVWKKEDIK